MLMQIIIQVDLFGLIWVMVGGDVQVVNVCLYCMVGGLGVVGVCWLGKQVCGLMWVLEEVLLVDSCVGLDWFSVGVECYLVGLWGVEFL